MKKLLLIILLLIKIPLAEWNKLPEHKQMSLVVPIIQEYCEQQSCGKADIRVEEDSEYVYISVKCKDYLL